ncbi:hypothetical protein TcCL_Unassigned07173, partial [Trypanosoma cruzi]
DNIRRNWFNVTSLGFIAGSGVAPVILPDGTLCINDPADTILLFVRRDRGMLSCVTRRAKGKVPSRAAEALRDLWCLFDEMTFSSRLSLMCYDPYMDALRVGLENSKILFVKVRSAVVAGLKRRLESEVEREESPPSPKNECLVSAHEIAAKELRWWLFTPRQGRLWQHLLRYTEMPWDSPTTSGAWRR